MVNQSCNNFIRTMSDLQFYSMQYAFDARIAKQYVLNMEDKWSDAQTNNAFVLIDLYKLVIPSIHDFGE